MQHPQPVRSTRSKPGLSECRMVAGIGRAKSQLLPMTCSRAVAMDGADIAGPSEAETNVCLKGLNCPIEFMSY